MIKSDQLESLKNLKRGEENILITIPSEIKYIREVSSKILLDIEPYKVNEDRLFDIKLCVEEAIRNAIVHGNRSNRKLSVKIFYQIENEGINIEVEDEGKGFDYKRLPDPTESDNIMRNSGRGVYLIRKLMDEVEFSETGNKIKMVKHLK